MSSLSVPVFLTMLLASCFVDAQPPIGGGGGPGGCPDPSPCVGLAAGATCYVPVAQTQDLRCGVCATMSGCSSLECVANADQSTCNAAPTCTKYATTNEVSQVCGTTRVIAGDELREPLVLSSPNSSVWQINMTVRLARWNATAFTATTRLYCVSDKGNVTCSMPGPTIRIKPGDRLNLTLWNELPPETTSTKLMNTLRLPNTVNVHTHGLHLDPSVDNVAVTVAPGASRTYEYVLPTEHLPGNHWYHSHVHGASSTQVLGGMSGMLFVDDDASVAAMSPTLAAVPSHALHIMQADFCSCNNGTGPFALRSYPYLQSVASDNNPLAFHNFQQEPGYSETQVMLVNGQYQPQLRVGEQEWHRLDLVNAQGEAYLELEILAGVGPTAPPASSCTMLLLARDGLWLKSGPRNVSVVLLAPASRASVAFQCNASGTYYLQSVPRNRATTSNDPNIQQNLLTIVVAGSSVTTTTAPTWSGASFPTVSYLEDTTAAGTTALHTFELGLVLRDVTPPATHWLGVGQNCTIEDGTANPNTFGQCAYEPFDHMGSFRFAAPACGATQMTINANGGAVPHPIHMHVFPMQIVAYHSDAGVPPSAVSALANWGLQVGDWLDTVPALPGRLVVRFHNIMIGQIMIHCHLLLHEDEGMMDRWWSGETSLSSCTATSLSANCNATVPSRAFEIAYASESVNCSVTALSGPVLYAPLDSSGALVAAMSLRTTFVTAMIVLLAAAWTADAR